MSGGIARGRLAEELLIDTRNFDLIHRLIRRVDCISDEDPSKSPKCKFPLGFFHPNRYPSGTVCLSILNEDSGCRPAITIRQLLVGIQDLLDAPNILDPTQSDGYKMFVEDKTEYRRRVRQQHSSYVNKLYLVFDIDFTVSMH
ncbi:hypothetical protein Leryth_006677 [Lithospermum erythrorhizon]|nr:hypothetical protein Leryth_006677 [Lithospermum erythrorhizon]